MFLLNLVFSFNIPLLYKSLSFIFNMDIFKYTGEYFLKCRMLLYTACPVERSISSPSSSKKPSLIATYIGA